MANNTTPSLLLYPSGDSSDLQKYGACYFSIYFAPNFDMNQVATAPELAKNSILLQTVDKWIKTGLKSKENISKSLQDSLTVTAKPLSAAADAGLNAISAEALTFGLDKTAQLAGYVAGNATAVQVAQSDDYEKNNQNIYASSKEKLMAEILLPFNDCKITRQSGVVQGGGDMVFKNLATIYAKRAIDVALQKGNEVLSKALSSQGIFARQMIGHSMSNIQYESCTLSWDMVPRNAAEALMIKQILTCFNGACISNIDLNDRSNLFHVLPPRVVFGVITQDATDENESQQQAGGFKKIKGIKWLRPKNEYYITQIDFQANDQGGGVYLDPNGDPSRIRLTVQLMKCNFTTVSDLFRDQHSNATDTEIINSKDKSGFHKDKDIGNGNPWV